jgi:hypothetical protein
MAAVLDWRLPEPAPTDPGPLPWLPGVPEALYDHPVWGHYLAKRSRLVTDLADRIRGHAGEDDTQPVWAPPGSRPDLAIMGEVAVWRAANGIHPNDPRPTGAAQLQTASAFWQHHLDRSLAHGGDDSIGRDIPERPPAATTRDRRHEDRPHWSKPPAVHPNSPPAPDHRSASRPSGWRYQILAGPKATPGGRQPSNLALSDQSAASPG